MNHKYKLILISTTLSLSMAQALAGEKPPKGSIPLSDIIKSLEAKGYSPITEVEIDDGVWEVEAYKEGKNVSSKTALTM